MKDFFELRESLLGNNVPLFGKNLSKPGLSKITKKHTQGYMDHMKKVNKGEVNKYPMRGKGTPLSQARKDAMFGKKKDKDYVEEYVDDNPGRKEPGTFKSDPELANLRLIDIATAHEKRKAARAMEEDIGGDESTTNPLKNKTT